MGNNKKLGKTFAEFRNEVSIEKYNVDFDTFLVRAPFDSPIGIQRILVVIEEATERYKNNRCSVSWKQGYDCGYYIGYEFPFRDTPDNPYLQINQPEGNG